MANQDPHSTGRRRPRILIHFPTVSYFGALLRIANAIQHNEIGNAILFAATRFPGYDSMQAQADEAGIKLLCLRGPDQKQIRDLCVTAGPCVFCL